jgi:hypothetical protein
MTDQETPIARVDGLERYYRPIETVEQISSMIFWASVILSVAVLYSHFIPWHSLQDVPAILFAACVVLHLILTLCLKFYIIPIAEGKRRKQLLSDAFSVPLTTEETQAYYNNPLSPSIQRLGANVLENSFFAKAVCGRMAIRERVKVLCYFTVWIIALFCRTTPLEVLVIVTQTVFSGEIISRLVSIEVLRHRNEDLYEELYHEFLHKIDFTSPTGTACILDAFATYEAAKAVASLKQSTRIFEDMNSELTREWINICERLHMEENLNKLDANDQ